MGFFIFMSYLSLLYLVCLIIALIENHGMIEIKREISKINTLILAISFMVGIIFSLFISFSYFTYYKSIANGFWDSFLFVLSFVMLPTIIGTLLLVLSYFFGYFLIQIIANRFAIGCFHATWVFPCAWVMWAFFQLITFDEPVTLLFLMPLAFVQIGFCKVALITIRPIMFGLISPYSSNYKI